MVLQRLQLTNFRGFESLDLTFEPDLTVLVGVNGCGKTSILDALAIGLGLRVEWKLSDVHVGTDSSTIRIDLLAGEPRLLSARISNRGFDAPRVPEFGGLVLFYTARRQADDRTPAGGTLPHEWTPRDARMTGFGPSGYEDFFRWLREMEDDENERVRYEGATEIPQLVAVRRAFQRLLPGYENLRVHRRGAMGQNIPRVAVEKGGKLLLFDALSEGERALMAMIADIARRLAIAYPGVDPLEQPCLLVIDEFEQHLHPQWQRELPMRMREVFPAAQMILTTHSPIVVSELLPRQLRALQGFRLLEGAHREGQDVNEILEALFGTPSRRRKTELLIDAIQDALDEDELDEAGRRLGQLRQELGSDDPEVVRLETIHRMLGASDHDAVSET